MLTLAILVALGQAEVDDVYVVAARISTTDQEIVRLDVPVDDSLLMELLDSLDKLYSNHEHSLKVEVALA